MGRLSESKVYAAADSLDIDKFVLCVPYASGLAPRPGVDICPGCHGEQ